jgi:mRNA interferase MazF
MVTLGRPDKTRPALILTRSSATRYLHAVTLAPITSTIRGAPTEIQVGPDEGLKRPSAANFDALQTVAKERVGRYLGSLDRRRKAEVRRALLLALELSEPDLT